MRPSKRIDVLSIPNPIGGFQLGGNLPRDRRTGTIVCQYIAALSCQPESPEVIFSLVPQYELSPDQPWVYPTRTGLGFRPLRIPSNNGDRTLYSAWVAYVLYTWPPDLHRGGSASKAKQSCTLWIECMIASYVKNP